MVIVKIGILLDIPSLDISKSENTILNCSEFLVVIMVLYFGIHILKFLFLAFYLYYQGRYLAS